MTLDDFAQRGMLHQHTTTAQEIADLWAIAEVGLADARVEAISLDRRFTAAYDAARSLATIPLACAGYRTAGAGHHATTFATLPLTMGGEYQSLVAFLDMCRVKRNVSEYRRVGQVQDGDVQDLIEAAEELRTKLDLWLATKHPTLKPSAGESPATASDAQASPQNSEE
jgi:hypothetical protein